MRSLADPRRSFENVSVITAVAGAAAPSRYERATLPKRELTHVPETLSRDSYVSFAGRSLAKLGEELRQVRLLVVGSLAARGFTELRTASDGHKSGASHAP